MPYTPPAADAIEFDFTASGYVAPAADAIVFEFALEQNVSRLGVQWGVTAPTLPISRLGARWDTDANREQNGLLRAQWATAIPASPTSRLAAQWETEVQPNSQSILLAQWDTDGAANPVSVLGAQWDCQVGEGISRLAIRYATLAPVERTSALTSRWETLGTPVGILRLDAQWSTEGTPATTGALALEWASFGTTEALAFLDAVWETLTAMDATSLLGVSWADLQYVEQECVIAYNDEATAFLEFYARIGLDAVASAVALDAGMLTTVAQSLELAAALGDVVQAVEVGAQLLASVSQSCEIVSPLLATVSQAVAIDAQIKDSDTVEQALEIVAPILGAAQIVVSTQPMLVIHGQRVPLASVDISIAEGQYAWTCDAELLDARQYPLFRANDHFTVELAGEEYAFIVDGKNTSRELTDSSVEFGASIAGISPAAAYAEPRSKRITKTWATATVASSVAAELMPSESVDWRIVDWAIPALRLAADSEAPIDIVRRVAAAAGGLLESEPDGSLYVRYAYPAPVADYVTGAPEQSYTDIDDRFTVSESIVTDELVNKLRILDVTPGAYADVLEFEADRMDPAQGKLRVYPSPWRTSFELEHTSLPIVSIERLGVETAEHTETVEVLAGEGSVRYPIFELVTLEWLYVDLGGITFEQDQRGFKSTSTTRTESLARITYRTRFVDHRAVAYQGAEVQFIVREPELA